MQKDPFGSVNDFFLNFSGDFYRPFFTIGILTFGLSSHFQPIYIFFFSDVWSAGCVLAELLLGQPIFPGDSGVDQLVEIIKVLGTPTREQIKEMNPNYTEFKFPQIKSHPWQKVSWTIFHHFHIIFIDF